VVDKFVLQLEAQLADRNVTIELSDEARDWLVEHGYDDAMGARPMARLIQETIKTPLADEVLFGRLKGGGAVRVVVRKPEDGEAKTGAKDGLTFEFPAGPVTPQAREGRDQRRQAPQARQAPHRVPEEDAEGQQGWRRQLGRRRPDRAEGATRARLMLCVPAGGLPDSGAAGL
jgi:ATP-dependent Clp protease ATP-binding subunit ClpA